LPYRAVVVATSLTALGLAAVPALAQAPRTLTFKETEKGSTFSYVDNPPRGTRGRPRPSIGDTLVFSEPLVSNSGARRGSLHATCTLTSNSTKSTPALCYGVFALKEGQIVVMVSSANLDAKTTEGAVIGGTRAYAGARGTFSSTTTKTGSDDTITLTG
jgi:hypothetical protein